MRAVNRRNGLVLADRLRVAQTFWSRGRGLLGSNGLAAGEGLLIRPCKGVHTFFMTFSIDVVFLDRDNLVLATVQSLKPERLTRLLFASTSVMELPAGTVGDTGTRQGDEIEIG